MDLHQFLYKLIVLTNFQSFVQQPHKSRFLIVKQYLRKNTQATASDLRKAMNVSRRILIPVLEKLDRDGLTARRGDVRVLRRDED